MPLNNPTHNTLPPPMDILRGLNRGDDVSGMGFPETATQMPSEHPFRPFLSSHWGSLIAYTTDRVRLADFIIVDSGRRVVYAERHGDVFENSPMRALRMLDVHSVHAEKNKQAVMAFYDRAYTLFGGAPRDFRRELINWIEYHGNQLHLRVRPPQEIATLSPPSHSMHVNAYVASKGGSLELVGMILASACNQSADNVDWLVDRFLDNTEPPTPSDVRRTLAIHMFSSEYLATYKQRAEEQASQLYTLKQMNSRTTSFNFWFDKQAQDRDPKLYACPISVSLGRRSATTETAFYARVDEQLREGRYLSPKAEVKKAVATPAPAPAPIQTWDVTYPPAPTEMDPQITVRFPPAPPRDPVDLYGFRAVRPFTIDPRPFVNIMPARPTTARERTINEQIDRRVFADYRAAVMDSTSQAARASDAEEIF